MEACEYHEALVARSQSTPVNASHTGSRIFITARSRVLQATKEAGRQAVSASNNIRIHRSRVQNDVALRSNMLGQGELS